MTADLADYLIALDKHVVVNGELKDHHHLIFQLPMNFSLQLASADDLDQNFFLSVYESEKRALKVSLHHQDDNTQYGLLRIDYNARHKNPESIIDTVPERFHPYVGQLLDVSHIHYVVDGYKPLAWALPLETDNFPIKDLADTKQYVPALEAFFHRINVRTRFTFNVQLQTL